MRSWRHALLVMALGGCADNTDTASMPVAIAGFDQVVLPGAQVTLDGSASFDHADRALTYDWRLLSKPAASAETLTSPGTVNPRLLVDVDGYYLVSLVVSNGARESLPDVVTFQASSTTNFPPLADARCAGDTLDAGCPQASFACGVPPGVPHGTTGCVHGNQSNDPNGDPLTFQWQQVFPGECASKCPGMSGCAPIAESVTWTQQNTSLGIFTTPADGVNFLVLQLSVSDGALASTSCIAFESKNEPPLAIITPAPAATSAEGEVFTLAGTPDADSDTVDRPQLVYAWTHEPSAVMVNYNPSATSNPVDVDVRGLTADTTVTFTLTVSDPFTSSDPCGTGGASCGGRACCGTVSVLITDVASADGQTCSFDSQCTSGNCECTNATCGGLRCRVDPCLCQFDGGGGCGVGDDLNNGREDPEDCDATTGCATPPCACQAGACQ